MGLRGEDPAVDSMETEPNTERGEEECINCAVWMGEEEDDECFLVKDRCRVGFFPGRNYFFQDTWKKVE